MFQDSFMTQELANSSIENIKNFTKKELYNMRDDFLTKRNSFENNYNISISERYSKYLPYINDILLIEDELRNRDTGILVEEMDNFNELLNILREHNEVEIPTCTTYSQTKAYLKGLIEYCSINCLDWYIYAERNYNHPEEWDIKRKFKTFEEFDNCFICNWDCLYLITKKR